MHSLIEYFILTQYQKDDQGHINMVRVAVGCVVQSLQNRNHLEKNVQQMQRGTHKNAPTSCSISARDIMKLRMFSLQ
jgi:hypothetical protein